MSNPEIEAVLRGESRWCVIEGDCFALLDFVGAVDAVVTDPPYGIGFAAQPTKWQRLGGMQATAWDDSAPNVERMLEAPIVAVWGGNYFSLPLSRGWLAWVKPDAPPSMGNLELCWTNRDVNAKNISHSIGATNAERVGHPTQKPLRVMEWTIAQLGLTADAVILDPFLGSGTTGVAAIKAGHRFIGIEREPSYCAIARRRIADAAAQGSLFQ